MCGIAAVIGSIPDCENAISQMTTQLRHRGPDAIDTVTLDGCSLGHTRLSIIDLERRSTQPMKCKVSGRWIVFNGEIYNHVELKAELSGYPFTTTSDTEVILAAFQKWGSECVHRFNGMFAFVIFEPQNNRTFIARDRFGIKPLFWAKLKNAIVLASEVKAFKGIVAFQPNLSYFSRYIEVGDRLAAHESCFQDVEQILPGQYIEIDAQLSVRTTRWYSVADRVRTLAFTGTSSFDVVGILEERMRSSLELRVRADVPISVNFSGGLDSSYILSMLSRDLGRHDILAQTAVSSGVSDEDRRLLLNIGKHCGVAPNWLEMEECPLISNPDPHNMMWHCEAPFRLSHYIDRCLARRSRELGRIVILDGNGADEHMLGYPQHLASAVPEFIRAGKLIHTLHVLLKNKNLRDFHGAHYIIKSCLQNLLGEKGVQPGSGWRIGETVIDFFVNKLHSLLWFRDRSSMAFGTELRVPFLDHELFEAMISLPLAAHIYGGSQKGVLKKAVSTRLPQEAIERKKNSFLMPVLPIKFEREYRKYIEDMYKEKNHWVELFDINSVDKISREQKFRIGMFNLWCHVFN